MPQEHVIYRFFGARSAVLGLILVSLAVFSGLMTNIAKANSLYIVKGIAIDATANTASAAKTVALDEGRRQAVTKLLDRLTMVRDRNRRPKANKAMLDQLINALEIANERSSQTRYLGELTVAFNQQAVRQWLGQAGIALSETQARPALIFPMIAINGRMDMWSGDNPWRLALENVENGQELLPLALPVGDLDDINILSVEQALQGAPDRLTVMKNRYDASTVMLVRATPTGSDPLAPAGLVIDYEELRDVGLVRRRFEIKSGNGDSLEEVLAKGARQLVLQLNEDWKSRTLLDLNARGLLSVIATFQQFQDWLTLQRRLETVPVLKRHDIDSLRKNEARLTLTHYGSRDKMITALAQSNLLLEEVEGVWQLRLRR